MRRAEYNDVPNRIIPPYVPIDTRRLDLDRSERIAAAVPSMRQPLLGEAPIDPYRQSYAPTMTFNGPVIDASRRRGFDKGPTGEDFTMGRMEARQPLLRNPRLAVEHVGGDMDISRSRSVSPQLVNARAVRDDRKRERVDRSDRIDREERGRSRRSRSRSRSHDRDRTRTRNRDRVTSSRDRDIVRDHYEPIPPVSNEQIRDGIVHNKDNYYEFLGYFIDEVNDRSRNSVERNVHGARMANEIITHATDAEKSRILLPPDFDKSDRERMLHCDTTISGLPVSIFFGSGYGPRGHYAKYAAAKDLVDKCHRIGVINSELHAAISDWKRLDRSFKTEFSQQISKAANAVILLTKRMTSEHLPPGFMTMRHLPSDLIDRFKTMLRMVMIDVYYQGIENSSTVVPTTLETAHDSSRSRSSRDSRPRDSDLRRHKEVNRSPREVHSGPSSEEIIRLKEKEIKEKMEMELERERQEMKQENRKQLEEELAKMRAELEMEKKLEIMKMQQQQYEIEKEKKELEEQQRKSVMMKQVEADFNTMVEQLEQRFVEVRAKGQSYILDLIYSSATFKTIQVYSTTLTSISYEQKQQLVKDLKELLDSIANELTKATVQTAMSRLAPIMGSYPPVPVAAPPMMPAYQLPQQSFGQAHVPNSSTASSSTSRRDETRRVTLGNMQLRALNSSEQRRLAKGDKVIAQDSKTGNWSLGVVLKINRDNRVTLAVGNTTWKKAIEDLYKEDSTAHNY